MKYIIAALFSLVMTAAMGLPANLPAALLYLGKPVDPVCFFNLDNSTTLIQLKNCGAAKEKYTIKDQDADLIKKGYVGFNWEDPASSSQGYSYYKVFDAGNNQYWVYSINNGGGSGDFTAINLVKRKNNDTLEIKKLAVGDRCNGGIQDVTEQNHQLTFSVNLTAFDLFDLANQNPHHLKAYDDLAACATCCAAKQFFKTDSGLKLKSTYVDLGEQSNMEEMSEQGTYHECFNKLFARYVTNGETKLDDAKVKKFVEEFNKTCVK